MNDGRLRVLKNFADRVRKDYANAQVFAFGSFVRGTASDDSDMDVCVVLSAMESDDRLRVSDLAWEVGFDHDTHISTIVLSKSDFDSGPISSSALLNSIRNEGIAA